MRVLRGAVRACGRLVGGILPAGHKPKMLTSTAQTRGRCHVRMPTVCNDGLKLAQRDSATPTPALVQTESYGHPLAALPQPLLEASLAQQDQVEVFFGRMLAVVHNMQEVMVSINDFQTLVSDAASAGLFSVWPFRGSNASCSNLVSTLYCLPDIIHTASLVQRLDAIFPYMEVILSTDSASSMSCNHSSPLHETLTFLAEAHDQQDVSEDMRAGIRRLMNQWGVARVASTSNLGVWSSQPDPSKVGLDKDDVVLWVVGALQAHRVSASDCSPSAALQLVPIKRPIDPAHIPQGLYTAEDVRAIAETAVQRADAESVKVRRALMARPNDKMMVRSYMRKHTLYYRRDFNQEMLMRKRQRDERQAELEKQQVIDLLPFTSLLVSMYDGSSDLPSIGAASEIANVMLCSNVKS